MLKNKNVTIPQLHLLRVCTILTMGTLSGFDLYKQWKLGSQTHLITNKSVHEQIFWTKNVSVDERCLEGGTWKLGVLAGERKFRCSFRSRHIFALEFAVSFFFYYFYKLLNMAAKKKNDQNHDRSEDRNRSVHVNSMEKINDPYNSPK